MLYGAIDAKPSEDMHHIHSIRNAPHLRMDANNWLAVCGPCHEAVEGRELEGMEVKAWSVRSYNEAMEACSGLNPGVLEKLTPYGVDLSKSLPRVSPFL
jgi:5-methylcytosine-specific restriction endonuclease McrA